MSEEEKAHNSLSKFVLKVTKDFLKNLDKERDSAAAKNQKEKIGGGETVDNSKIKVELDNSFKQSPNIYSLENWDSNIFSHPVVENFITKLEQDLRKSNYDDNEVNNLLFEYKAKLKTRAAEDEDYKKFFDWWKGQRHYVEFKKYLTSIEALKYYRTITEQDKDKELDAYYVRQRDAVLADADREWTGDDNVLRKKYKPENVEEIVQKYIQESKPEEPYLVIGASFGSGKSSLVRMISSKYATDFLDNKQDYIPIPVVLGLTNEEEDFITAYEKNRLNLSLDNVLENIIAVSEEISSNRILLILDGLDEYGDRNTSVGGNLRKLLDSSHKYQNTKVLITSRLEDDILTKQHISSIRKYVRLLPFEPTQMNYFFERYGVKVGNRLLDNIYASELKLPVEEMTKPLFAWSAGRVLY